MRNGPAEYRKLAEECRRNADGFDDGPDRSRWLRIAERWMVIAQTASEFDPAEIEILQPASLRQRA